MSSTFSATAARTSTFTEARVRYVMAKVLEDLMMVAVCQYASLEQVKTWCEDVTEVLLFEAAELFQIKFNRPDGEPAAINYRISDDGSISEDRSSGGVNYFVHPSGTKASIVLRLRAGAKKRQAALDYLEQHGWTFNGTVLEDDGVSDGAYSSAGYGLTRNKIGKWQ